MQRLLGTLILLIGYGIEVTASVVAAIRLLTPEDSVFAEDARLPLILAGLIYVVGFGVARLGRFMRAQGIPWGDQ